jgi:hypothetical protein
MALTSRLATDSEVVVSMTLDVMGFASLIDKHNAPRMLQAAPAWNHALIKIRSCSSMKR